MPATPPTVFTPPSVPTPSAPGAVHAVPSASPAAPGAVHAAPMAGAAVAQVFSITSVGTAAEDGFVRVAYSFLAFVGELNVYVDNGDTATACATKIKSDIEAVSDFTANFAITQDGPTLHLTYLEVGAPLSMVFNYTAFASGISNSTGSVSIPASEGGDVSTPPAIHSAPAAAPGMPPAITP